MFNRQMIVPVLLVGIVGLIIVLKINAAEVQKININTASAEELVQLRGIGPSHAAKIVAYRQKNGPFKMPEDLVQVPGIGQKTFQANHEFIIVEESKTE
jgi:competence protein ComEA